MAPSSMKYNPAFLDDDRLIQSFFARNAEFETILEVLRENTVGSNQHLLIIGPRGIGKTTLVLRSAAEIRTDATLGAQLHPVVFGEETYQVGSPGEFWLEALFHLGEQTGDPRWKKAYEELLLERDEGRLRARVLAQLMDFADQQEKRLVLVVENLNMLVGDQISGDDAWVLRHTLMNEPRLMLLGTATSRFKEVEEYNQALYDLFRIVELEPLEDAEVQALWTATTGQGTTARQIRPLQILTGGNPRLIRILSEFAANTSFRSLMDDLTRLVDEHTEYFKHHLDNLPPQERKVFVALADLWDPSTARKVAEAARLDVNTTSAMLKRLMGRGAVTMAYKRGKAQYYQVAERMYNIYHLMRRRGQAASRVHAVVRFMVSLYRDEELVRTTKSLVEEASRLARDQRSEHFLAYEAILTHARQPRLMKQLVEATRFAFEAMPDVPESLMRLIGLSPPVEAHQRADVELANDKLAVALRVEDVEDVSILLRLAILLSENPNHFSEAEAAYRKVLERDPHNTVGWVEFGLFLGSQMDRPEEALESFDRALSLNSEDRLAWFGKGIALSALDRLEDTVIALDRALMLGIEEAILWVLRGTALARLGRGEEAVISFDRALALDSEHASTWTIRGIVLGHLGRDEDAVGSFDRALALDATIASTWFDRGASLHRLGRSEEALKCYGRALELDATIASALIDKGTALIDFGRPEEAVEAIDRVLDLDAKSAGVWLVKGAVLRGGGRPEEAVKSFDRALELDNENATAFLGRGLTQRTLMRFQGAEDDLRRALALGVDGTSAQVALVELLLEDLNRPTEALIAARESAEQASNSAGLLNSLALAFFKNGQKEYFNEAEAWARRAVEQAPEDGLLRHTLACLLGAQGKWADALGQASIFLADQDMLTGALAKVIDFFIDAVAAGHEDEVLRIVQISGRAETFEPLIVAIQQRAGAQIDVAREILEVAKDVSSRIDARRTELQAT